MESIQFIQISPDQLKKEILEGVKMQLDQFKENFQPKTPPEYLTRHEVAKMFSVDVSTVHNWSQPGGKLKKVAIGSRIYYLRSEVEKAITRL